MPRNDPYSSIDPILDQWASKYRIRIAKLARGTPVRSVWVYDRQGNQRGQMWLDPPDDDGSVKVIAVEYHRFNKDHWGHREEHLTTASGLETALEQLRQILMRWAGEGGYTD
jgi:hypothetical protein